MELPIKFPSDAEVIREEVTRFRALSPDERAHLVRGMLNTGHSLMRHSPRFAFLREQTESQETHAHELYREVITRYGD